MYKTERGPPWNHGEGTLKMQVPLCDPDLLPEVEVPRVTAEQV